MQDKERLVTFAFVLIIGLLGGYMIAQHAGGVAHEHREAHEAEEGHAYDNLMDQAPGMENDE